MAGARPLEETVAALFRKAGLHPPDDVVATLRRVLAEAPHQCPHLAAEIAKVRTGIDRRAEALWDEWTIGKNPGSYEPDVRFDVELDYERVRQALQYHSGKSERYTFFLRVLRAYHCVVFPPHMAKLRQERETLPVFLRPLTFDEFEAIFFQSEVTDTALLRGQAGAGEASLTASRSSKRAYASRLPAGDVCRRGAVFRLANRPQPCAARAGQGLVPRLPAHRPVPLCKGAAVSGLEVKPDSSRRKPTTDVYQVAASPAALATVDACPWSLWTRQRSSRPSGDDGSCARSTSGTGRWPTARRCGRRCSRSSRRRRCVTSSTF